MYPDDFLNKKPNRPWIVHVNNINTNIETETLKDAVLIMWRVLQKDIQSGKSLTKFSENAWIYPPSSYAGTIINFDTARDIAAELGWFEEFEKENSYAEEKCD